MNHFITFIQSNDFLEGIWVEIAGAIIQGIFILVLIPIVLLCYRRIRYNPTNFLISFEVLQIFRDCISMFVNISFGDRRLEVLLKSVESNEISQMFNHKFYGTLQDDLFLMLKKSNRESILSNIENKTTDQIEEIIKTINISLDRMEKLAFMASFNPKKQEFFYKLRVLFFPLRDAFDHIKSNPSQMVFLPFGNQYTIPDLIIGISSEINDLSKEPIKIIDRRLRRQELISNFLLILDFLKSKLLRSKKS